MWFKLSAFVFWNNKICPVSSYWPKSRNSTIFKLPQNDSCHPSDPSWVAWFPSWRPMGLRFVTTVNKDGGRTDQKFSKDTYKVWQWIWTDFWLRWHSYLFRLENRRCRRLGGIFRVPTVSGETKIAVECLKSSWKNKFCPFFLGFIILQGSFQSKILKNSELYE